MAADMPHQAETARALAALEQERKEEAESKKTVWAFVWTLFGFKIVTIGIVWYAASGSSESTSMLLANAWYWIAIPIVAIAGPLVYRWRLVKQRRRRGALHAAEWSTTGGSGTNGGATGDIQIIVQQTGGDVQPHG